jgi:predicted DNA-binding mobile mystery protein A
MKPRSSGKKRPQGRPSSPPPEFAEIQRRQLDAHFRKITTSVRTALDRPRTGWIKAIRTALGMTQAQLAGRLKVTRQNVARLERDEIAGRVTIRAMQDAADALGCELIVALVPRQPLEQIVRQQAQTKAQAERSRLLHTMRLEAQEESVNEALDPDAEIEKWLTDRRSDLWD